MIYSSLGYKQPSNSYSYGSLCSSSPVAAMDSLYSFLREPSTDLKHRTWRQMSDGPKYHMSCGVNTCRDTEVHFSTKTNTVLLNFWEILNFQKLTALVQSKYGCMCMTRFLFLCLIRGVSFWCFIKMRVENQSFIHPRATGFSFMIWLVFGGAE